MSRKKIENEVDQCKAELKKAHLVLAAILHKLGGFIRIEAEFLESAEKRNLKVWLEDDGTMYCAFRRI